MTDVSTCLRVNAPHVIHETIDGEVIVINMTTGNYYSMKGSGSAVWNALQRTPADPAQLAKALEPCFDASPGEIKAAVEAFVVELLAEELVVEADAPQEMTSPNAPAIQPDTRTFERPVLEKFTDMQDLVLLDPVHEVDGAGWPHARPDEAPSTVAAQNRA